MLEFDDVSTMGKAERMTFFKDRHGHKKRLRISFGSTEEIERILTDTKMKMSIRNMLGVKSPDDWIQNFNIGNIMHLQPLNFDDLNRSSVDVRLEIGKDMVIEKILYASASYFCIGTEYRFLSAKRKEEYSKKDGEMYHAKSLHVAATFLPADCPMVDHIKKAYQKHHLGPKLEQKKEMQRKAEEQNMMST